MSTRSFTPYYSPAELVHSSQLTPGLIEKISLNLGFPRRTIATAQSIHYRALINHSDIPSHDLAITAILVASKLQDTLKKLRDIQAATHALLAQLDPTHSQDTYQQESHRPQLIAIERLLLSTLCFNFNLQREVDSDTADKGKDVFAWNIRLAKSLKASKSFTFLSHLIAIDLHRLPIPLSYPPHTIALGAIYLASFLIPGHRNSIAVSDAAVEGEYSIVEQFPTFESGWIDELYTEMEDIEEIAHAVLNLFIKLCPPSANSASASNPTTNLSSYPSPAFSPYSPSSHPLRDPSNPSGAASGTQGARDKLLWNTGVPHTLSGRSAEIIEEGRSIEGLTGIKIRLREVEGRRRESVGVEVASVAAVVVEGEETVATTEASPAVDVAVDSPSTTEVPPAKPTKSLKRSSSTANSSARQSGTSHPTIAPRKRSKPERWIGAAAALEEKAKEDGVSGKSGRGKSGSSGGRDREREAKEREELVNGSVRYRF